MTGRPAEVACREEYDCVMTVSTLMTADELLALPDDGWKYELVRGELRKMSPAGTEHGGIAAEIIGSLISYVKQHKLGKVYSEIGFRLERDPDTVRAADAAFVRADRVVRTRKYFEGPPDAAFEVISPNDLYTEVDEKTLEWLNAGCLVIIVVNPRTKSATIYRKSGGVTVTDAIEIDDVIPGWKLPLAEIFD